MTDRASLPFGLLSLLALSVLACSPADHDAEEAARGERATCSGLEGQTIRLIVPYTSGGGYDVNARLLEPFYEEAIGAQIVVENRVGAAGRVGARLVHDAAPDGRTLGLVSGAGLVIQGLLDPDLGLHPMEDFTPIGRVAVAAPVLMAARDSPFSSWRKLRDSERNGPLVIGVTGISDSSWIWFIVASELLHLDATYLAGYPGTRESSLGLIRGEFDLAGYTFDSMLDRVEGNDLVPVAQLSRHPEAAYPRLRDVPVLGGADGLAAQRARELGYDPDVAARRAAALDRIFQAGRLIVAPPGVDPDLTECLRERFAEAVQDSGFLDAASRARRRMAFADPATIAAELQATAVEREELGVVFRRWVDAARSGPPSR